MSDTTTDPATSAGPPSAPTSAAGMPQAPGGPGGAPGGAGASPVLAALARNRMQAQPSQPGMGTQAGALQKLAMAVDLLQQALPALGTGSQEHSAVLSAIRSLSRHAGGSSGQGAQQTAIQDMLRNTVRNAMLQRVMAQQGQGGQQPPQPSTPLPGA